MGALLFCACVRNNQDGESHLLMGKQLLSKSVNHHDIQDLYLKTLECEYNKMEQYDQFINLFPELKRLKANLLGLLKGKPDNLFIYKRAIEKFLNYISVYEGELKENQQGKLLILIAPKLQELLDQSQYPLLLLWPAYEFLTQHPDMKGELITPQNQHTNKMDKHIQALKDFENNQDYKGALPNFVMKIIQQLSQYYETEKTSFFNQLNSFQNDEEIKKFAEQTINEGICQITAPFFGSFLVSKQQFDKYLMKSNENAEELIKSSLTIERIPQNDVYQFQRQLLVYMLSKLLFQIDIQPQIVIRSSQISVIENEINDQNTSFTVSLLLEKGQQDIIYDGLQDFQVSSDGQQLELKKDSSIKIKKISFLNHIISSLVINYIDEFMPQFQILQNENQKEGCTLHRIFKNVQKHDDSNYNALKSPILFFKQLLIQCCITKEELSAIFKPNNNYDLLLFQALQIISQGEWSDFIVNKQSKEQNFYSLYISEAQLITLKQIVHQLSLTNSWITEAILPQQDSLLLVQIIDQNQKILLEFSSKNQLDNLKVYQETLTDINIEQFLQKAIQVSTLREFNQLYKHFQFSIINQEFKEDQEAVPKHDIHSWLLIEDTYYQALQQKFKITSHIAKQRTLIDKEAVVIQNEQFKTLSIDFIKDSFKILTLQEILQQQQQQQQQQSLLGVTAQGQYFAIPQEIIEQIFDVDKQQNEKLKLKFKVLLQDNNKNKYLISRNQQKLLNKGKTNDYRNCIARRLQVFSINQKKSIYVEQNPRYPGLDVAIQILNFLFTSQSSKVDRIACILGDSTPFLLTLDRPDCLTLRQALTAQQQDEIVLKTLDQESLSQRILINMILCPGIEAPEDILLIPKGTGKAANIKQLEFIGDAENCFSQSIIRSTHEGRCKIGIKSILYCMDYMHKPIHPKVIQQFQQLDPRQILQLFYEQAIVLSQNLLMLKGNQTYKKWQDVIVDPAQVSRSKSKLLQTFLGIPFSRFNSQTIFKNLYRLTQILRLYQADDQHKLTHQGLLNIIDPVLGRIYEQVNQSSLSLIERFKLIENDLSIQHGFLKSNLPTFLQAFSLIQQSESLNSKKQQDELQQAQKTIHQLVKEQLHIGPSQSLSQLHKYAEILPEYPENLDLVKYSLNQLNTGDELFYFCQQFNFFNKQQQNQMEQGEDGTNETYLNELFPNKIKEIQQQYLERVQNFILYHQPLFDSKKLQSYEATLQQITSLILNDTAINNEDLIYIAKTCRGLVYLDLSNNPAITQFNAGQTLIWRDSKPIEFFVLQTLILNNMSQMKLIDVTCLAIQNLSIDNCPNLTIALAHCNLLRRVSARGCPNLNEENLLVWIINGCEVALCAETSKGYFSHFIKQQQQQENIANLSSTFSENTILNVFGKVLLMIKNAPGFFDKSGSGIFSCNDLHYFLQKLNFAGNQPQEEEDDTKRLLAKCLLFNPNLRNLKFSSICAQVPNEEISDLVLVTLTKLLEVLKIEKSKKLLDNLFECIDFSNLPQGIQLNENHYNAAIEMAALLKQKSNLSKGLNLILQENITDQVMDQVGVSLQKAGKSIVSLDFQNNTSLQKVSQSLANILKISEAHQSLTRINLSNCSLDDQTLKTLSSGFSQNKTVKILDLSRNSQLTSVGFNTLFKDFGKNNILHTLSLAKNTVSDVDFTLLLSTQLKNLYLQNCNGLNFENLGLYLKGYDSENKYINPCSLVTLDVSKVQIDQNSIQAMAEGLQKNLNLKQLNLNKSLLSSIQKIEVIQSIVKALTPSQSIASIELSGNELTDSGLIQISQLFKENKSVKNLCIQEDTTFTQKGIEQFISNIPIYENLVNVDSEFGNKNNSNSNLKSILIGDLSNEQIQEIAYSLNPSTSGMFKKRHEYFSYSTRRSSEKKIDHTIMGLAIDGGGMRGVIPAQVIEYFCGAIKLNPCEIFNVVGGTSIGGILSLGLTITLDGKNPILPYDGLVNMLQENGPTIFSTSKMAGLWKNAFRDSAKYPAEGIDSVLSSYFKGSKLSDVVPGCNVIVTAVKREIIQDNTIAKIFNSVNALFDPSENYYAKDCARATSAAPTFFPSAEISNLLGQSSSLVDGGVGQNNPAKFVLEEAQKLAHNEGDDKNFFVLSIDTGMGRYEGQLDKQAGILNIFKVLESFGASCADFVDLELQESQKSRYFRVKTKLDMLQSDAVLDVCDPKLLNQYLESAKKAAIRDLKNNCAFGSFGDRNLIDWFRENTDKKRDYYI